MTNPKPIRDEDAEIKIELADDFREDYKLAQNHIDRYARQLRNTQAFIEKLEDHFADENYYTPDEAVYWGEVLRENKETRALLEKIIQDNVDCQDTLKRMLELVGN